MDRETIDALITSMVQSGNDVSDLLFIQGKVPLVESHGKLNPFPIDTPDSLLTPEILDALAAEFMKTNPRLRENYEKSGSCDTSYEVPGIARLRVNIFKHNSGKGVVMRRFPSRTPTLDGLNLPPIFRDIVKERNGIILVTGATGSGKTTTLAAMLNYLNQTEPIHILTLEDPIEFIYPAGRAAISQRELGRDFESFSQGLRVALRQAPKGILLGEIRDRETMEIAITAAETGHIVFSTVHTINAGQTINRILGFFSRDEEEQVRIRLADILRYVVSQRLVATVSGGRLLITEVLGNSLRTRETIRYGESEGKTFHEIIEAASTSGWHTFDQCLLKALGAGQISEETALLQSNNKGRMRRDLDLFQKQKPGAVEGMSGLKMDVSSLPKRDAAGHPIPVPVE